MKILLMKYRGVNNMYSFELDLLGYRRPMISLYGNPSIIDTGAVVPITWLSPELLEQAWNAKIVLRNTSISGIGGEAYGDIYALFDFKIGDINFNRIEMFVLKDKISKYTFLLSATLFHGLKYDIDDTENQKFIVNVPDNLTLNRDFRIKSLEGKIYAEVDGVLLQDIEEDIEDIDNFTQITNNEYFNRKKSR